MHKPIILALLFVMACSPIEQRQQASRAAGEAFASVGDVVLHVNVSDNLPNAFGRADLFGRRRDRGFSELRYLGLAPDGRAVFQRRDIDIATNETVFSRMPNSSFVGAQGQAGFTGNRFGSQGNAGWIASGSSIAPTPADIQLVPSGGQFAIDLSQGRRVTIQGRAIDIVEATGAGIRFVVR